MGTPSYLGYEAGNKNYEQYMQYDGYPLGRGKELYEAVVNTLMEDPSYFIEDTNPNARFFLRIRHFLKEKQYAAYHSFNEGKFHPKKDWGTANMWEYLFHKNGDFSFSPPSCNWTCTIPWEFTSRLIYCFSKADMSRNPLDPFWKSMKAWKGTTTPPVLRLKSYQSMSFPNQKEQGWRYAGILTVGKKKHQSMFAEDEEKKDILYSRATFKSDYLIVKRCSRKKLPLLIGAVHTKEAINLLEGRLKNG